MSIQDVLGFAVVEFFLCLSPGPAVLLIVSQGMAHGAARSLAGILGILAANVIFFLASALGLGAILIASRNVFLVVRMIGAVYLVYLGASMVWAAWKGRGEKDDSDEAKQPRRRKLFLQGFITQISNPKAIMMFAALYPQFIDVDASPFAQFAVLGGVSIVIEFHVLLAYAWLSDRGRRLMQETRFPRYVDGLAGLFLVAAGIKLALTKFQ